jgi:hypothetical protein
MEFNTHRIATHFLRRDVPLTGIGNFRPLFGIDFSIGMVNKKPILKFYLSMKEAYNANF